MGLPPIKPLLAALVVEALGTMFLTVFYARSVLSYPLILFGFTLIVGNISGAQFNPAVTLGMIVSSFLAKEINCNPIEGLLNMAAQFIGAIVGAFIAWLVTNSGIHGVVLLGTPNGAGFVFMAEFVAATVFIWVFIHLHADTDDDDELKRALGIAVTLTGCLYLVGGFASSTPSLNPAIDFATIMIGVFDDGTGKHIWIGLIAPFLGAMAGMGIFVGISTLTGSSGGSGGGGGNKAGSGDSGDSSGSKGKSKTPDSSDSS